MPQKVVYERGRGMEEGKDHQQVGGEAMPVRQRPAPFRIAHLGQVDGTEQMHAAHEGVRGAEGHDDQQQQV